MAAKRKRVLIVLIALLAVLSLLRIHYYAIRSVVVMWPYSLYHEQMSLMKKNDFNIEMPAGMISDQQGWHPLMIVFHDAEGFSNWTGEAWELTVLYRFGGFESGENHSAYYCRNSKRFSSFYGAYLIQHQEEPNAYYGFDSTGKMNPSAFMKVTEYDQRYLVMPSLGLSPSQVIFEVEMLEKEENIPYLQHNHWTRVDALIYTNSPEHRYREHQQGYLQYGLPIPPPEGKEDFYSVMLYGRIYARMIKSSQLSMALYILAPDMETLNEIDASLLSKTILPVDSMN
ncbi:MAG: hypothetical protein SCK57_02240 [Bacillota bacterium]|nr:hypothetical protein [Bacillota bacterium]MDW7676460.1 hypothetical protein [Bacillota bacterium]